jgi:hypothetical protein
MVKPTRQWNTLGMRHGYIYGADGKIWSDYIDQVNADVDFNTLKADIDLAFRIEQQL